MELGLKKEFVWPSNKEEYHIKDLAEDLRSSDVVDINSCVIADIDYFHAQGIILDSIIARRLVADFKILEEAFRKTNQEEGEFLYNPDKLISMANIIFRRWRGKSLNNYSLEKEIDQRVCNEIINSWCSLSSIKEQAMSCVHRAIDNDIQKMVIDIVEKFMSSKYDDSYNFNGLEESLIRSLEEYYRIHRESKHKNDIVELIGHEKEKIFLVLFKQKSLDNAQLCNLQEDIENNWIHIVQHRKYVKTISSLDYYCWELAVAEARESGRFCTVRMEKFIKAGLRKIIDAWRENALPEIAQLEGHLKKYLVDYQAMARQPELDQLITRRVVGNIIAQRSSAFVDFLRKACHSEVSAQVFKQMKLGPHSSANRLVPIVMNMIERYKTEAECDYHDELREIADFLYERLINTGLKVDKKASLSPIINRYRFLNGSALIKESGNTNECLPGEVKKSSKGITM